MTTQELSCTKIYKKVYTLYGVIEDEVKVVEGKAP